MRSAQFDALALLRRAAVAVCVVLAGAAQGQIEFAEPTEGHHFGKAPLGSTFAAQYYGLFNRGPTAVNIGALRIDGQMAVCTALGCPVIAPDNFVLRDPDGCSNRVLAVGQACSSLIVFSPKAAGARTARVVFPVVGGAELSRLLNGTGVSDPTDCVLDWAERSVPTLLAPSASTVVAGPYLARCYAGGTLCVGTDVGAQPLASASVYVLQNGQLRRFGSLPELAATSNHAPPSALACSQPRPQP